MHRPTPESISISCYTYRRVSDVFFEGQPFKPGYAGHNEGTTGLGGWLV